MTLEKNYKLQTQSWKTWNQLVTLLYIEIYAYFEFKNIITLKIWWLKKTIR